jgi:hypothetical protein
MIRWTAGPLATVIRLAHPLGTDPERSVTPDVA